MRISDIELNAIKNSLNRNFGKGSKVWLFGSRVDYSKKGGDIDLYIETDIEDVNEVFDAKSNFIVDICKQIGNQKIDVIVKYKGKECSPIEKIAKDTGVVIK